MIKMDVIDTASIHEAIARIISEQGRIDVVVNNAGVGISGAIELATDEEIAWQMNTNFTGVTRVCSAVLPYMRKAGKGKIINISSSAAKHFFPGFGAYAASKGGIVSFTHTLSEEVKKYGINVNAIYLGMTNTEHTRERMDSDQAVTIDLDSMLQVEDVAEVVTFLASDAAAPIMGAAIDVFGKKS